MTNREAPERAKYDELSYYTLARSDPAFIHQHIVDAYTAQTAEEGTKPIAIAFALLGLYLALDKGFTGREVQRAHMRLGRKKRPWPAFRLPKQRGEITVSDVVTAPPGRPRDDMIRRWCVSVWEAYRESHHGVAAFWDEFIAENAGRRRI